MKEPIYIKVFDLYVRGFSAREIARYVYGREDAANRVRRMIHYARKKLTALPVPLLSESVKQRGRLETKLWNNPDKVIDIKRGVKKPEDRQLITHEQLIYYLMRRLGFKVTSPEVITAKHFHYKYFRLFYRRYGDSMRCWRNGNRLIPFSFTLDSLSYCYAVVQGTLILFGHVSLTRKLEDIVRELLPSKKQSMIYQFYHVFADIGGQVLGRIVHPHI